MPNNNQQNEVLRLTEAQYQELLNLHNVFDSSSDLRKEMWQLIIDATNNKELMQSFHTSPTDHIFNMMQITEALSSLWDALATKEFES
jgi:hypothetical protein